MAAAGDVVLTYCEHQVGGHFKADEEPAILKDTSGKIYKALQSRGRAEREPTFYQLVALACEAGDQPLVVPDDHYFKEQAEGLPDLAEDLQGLQPLMPKYYGLHEVGQGESAKRYLVLEDLAEGYRQPCVMDIKIGFKTTYPWMPEESRIKKEKQDKERTQSTLGFTVVGLQVYVQEKHELRKVDRDWCRQLNDDSVMTALALFTSNAAVGQGAVCRSILQAVGPVQSWFEEQTSLQLFASSLLITYEGAATKPEELRTKVRLVDFAHAFPINHPGSEGHDHDMNCLFGLTSFMEALNRMR